MIATSGSDYIHDSEKPGSSNYLSMPVVRELRRIDAKRVLDLGCGNGWFTKELQDLGMSPTGIDPSKTGIEHAKTIAPSVLFYQSDIYENTFDKSEFDAVVSLEVIEHLFDPAKLAQFARARLKDDGRLMLTTPYHGYVKNLAMAITNKWDFHHHPCRFGGHIKFFSRKTLIDLIEPEGFRFEKFVGCGRVFGLWKSMLIVFRKA